MPRKCRQLGIAEEVARRARQVVGDGPVYVSFDIDSVDPGFAPGTGTPEVGGLTPARGAGAAAPPERHRHHRRRRGRGGAAI